MMAGQSSMLDLLGPATRMPRALLAIGRAIPVLLTVLGLYLLESLTEVEPPAAVDIGTRSADGRVLILWIDSLSTLDMAEPQRLTRLKARLSGGLHGEVRACMDGMSVPCFTAATTGGDRFSLFSLARNFGGAGGVAPGSVLHAFKERGLRLGFIGDPQIAAAVRGFDHVDILNVPNDADTARRAERVLDAGQIDLLIVHFREPDEISHAQGPAHARYAEAMEVVDREVEALLGRLRPQDTAFIYGDHGHTADGQHFAGLDVPTLYAAFGPLFQRAARHDIAMTDEGSLWSRPLGVRWGETPWLDAYLSGAELPQTAPPGELPPLNAGNAPLPPLGAGLGLLLAVVVAWPARGRWLLRRDWRALLGVLFGFGVAAFALGATYMSTRPILYWRGPLLNIGIGGAFGLLGVLLAVPAMRDLAARSDPAARSSVWRLVPGLLIAGAVALAVPTVYKYGGFYTGLSGFMLAGAVALGLALVRRDRKQSALLLLLGLVAWRTWDPVVKNFAVREFRKVIPGVPQGLSAAALIVLALALAAGPVGGRRRFLAAGAVGLALAAAGPFLPPHLYLLPCLAALPLALYAHRRGPEHPAAALAILAALPAFAFFLQFEPGRIAPVACALAAFPLWARARADAPRLERALGLVVLLWMGLWVMLGCRLAGLDFNYFFRWLPAGAAVEDTWGYNALLTTALYLAVPVVGILLARRAAPKTMEGVLPVAWHFARLKLALVLIFILGFTMHCADAGPFIMADVIMEAGVWVVVLLFLVGLPLDAGSGAGLVHEPGEA